MTTETKSKSRLNAQEPEWVVWVLVAVMLLAGWIIKTSIDGRTESFNGGGVSLSYPAAWAKESKDAPVLFYASETLASHLPSGVQVQQMPLAELGKNLNSPDELAMAWSMQYARDLTAYSTLNVDVVTVSGQEAVAIEYAYVPQAADTTGVPMVARARDLLIRQGDNLTVITLVADAADYDQASSTWDAILATLKIQ